MKKKLLLVDDEESILKLICTTIQNDHRYEVLCASKGREALELVRKEHPALVFLDIKMPGINGFQVCRILKEDPETASIPIVMLTALAGEADRQMGMEMGADDYITKPFSPMVILDKVEEVLGLT